MSAASVARAPLSPLAGTRPNYPPFTPKLANAITANIGHVWYVLAASLLVVN
jgi:hypothetical protein